MSSKKDSSCTSQVVVPNPLHLWLQNFILDARAANRSDATIEFYLQKLRPFLSFLEAQGVREPSQVQANHLRAFLAHLGESHGSGGVHAYWRAIRAFVRFLMREETIDGNPLAKMRSPKLEQELLDSVPTGTVQALLCTCDDSHIGLRDRAIILTLLDTGLRASEMVSLNIADVDLDDGSIALHKTKSSKGRFVFIGRQARIAIDTYLQVRQDNEPQEPVWLAYHRDGKCARLQYEGLRDIVRRRAKQAHVEAPTLHSFRRSFAITMLRNGADLVSLSRMMGHGSLPVLTRYLKQIKGDLAEVHARHSPVDTLL